VSLAVSVVGQASKRGIVPRVPSAGRIIEDVEQWVRAEYVDAVRRIERTQTELGLTELHIALHPAAPDVSIVVGETGRVMARAETSPAGPGYHTFVGRLLQRLGSDRGIAWEPVGPDVPAAVGVGHPDSGDRRDIERAHLGWLGSSLVRAAEARRLGSPPVHLATPPGVRFEVDGALATPLGPRDDAWLARALTDARVAIDIWPWFSDATDGRYFMNRALTLMWAEIRWRRPTDADERALVDETLRLLHRAYPLDPSLAFPWREWRELALLRPTPDSMAALIEERAAAVDPSTPLVGYRRRPVSVTHDGWAIVIPGTFTERRTGGEWRGGDAGRSIALASVPIATNGRLTPAETILRQVAGNLGPSALAHQAGDVVGRARVGTDDGSGITVGIVEGFAAVDGSGTAIRVEFDDPADWEWALDQWRALRPA
jgi:hypothetical protein